MPASLQSTESPSKPSHIHKHNRRRRVDVVAHAAAPRVVTALITPWQSADACCLPDDADRILQVEHLSEGNVVFAHAVVTDEDRTGAPRRSLDLAMVVWLEAVYRERRGHWRNLQDLHVGEAGVVPQAAISLEYL